MLKKTITYVDFDGNERTEDHYFNLTMSEVRKLFVSVEGGLSKYLSKIMADKDNNRLNQFLDTVIRAAYGQKSLDGRRMMKSDEIFREFEESLAYDQFYMELIHNDAAAAEFINGVFPTEMAQRVSAEIEKRRLAASGEPLSQNA